MSDSNRSRINSYHEPPKSSTLGGNPTSGERKNLLHERLNAIKKGEKSSPREKFNSTSTTFVDSTIQNPDKKILMRCLAERVLDEIQPQDKTDPQNRKELEVFDEALHPMTTNTLETSVPKVEELEKFINDIFKAGDMHPAAVVMAAAYLTRTLAATSVKLYPWSWRRVLLTCLILASKVWEDESVWNVDFLELFPSSTLKDLSSCETKILNLLSFDVEINASQYTKTYFELRSKAHLKSKDEYFPEPLSNQEMERLQISSKKLF